MSAASQSCIIFPRRSASVVHSSHACICFQLQSAYFQSFVYSLAVFVVLYNNTETLAGAKGFDSLSRNGYMNDVYARPISSLRRSAGVPATHVPVRLVFVGVNYLS